MVIFNSYVKLPEGIKLTTGDSIQSFYVPPFWVVKSPLSNDESMKFPQITIWNIGHKIITRKLAMTPH